MHYASAFLKEKSGAELTRPNVFSITQEDMIVNTKLLFCPTFCYLNKYL